MEVETDRKEVTVSLGTPELRNCGRDFSTYPVDQRSKDILPSEKEAERNRSEQLRVWDNPKSAFCNVPLHWSSGALGTLLYFWLSCFSCSFNILSPSPAPRGCGPECCPILHSPGVTVPFGEEPLELTHISAQVPRAAVRRGVDLHLPAAGFNNPRPSACGRHATWSVHTKLTLHQDSCVSVPAFVKLRFSHFSPFHWSRYFKMLLSHHLSLSCSHPFSRLPALLCRL